MAISLTTISTITDVASFIVSCLKESPIKKIMRTEILLAMHIGENLAGESKPREGLNRMLSHLESAIALYGQTIFTWDFMEPYKSLWNQYEFYNKLCVLIAMIHYSLGNQKLVSKWLIEEMSPEGPWNFKNNSSIGIAELGLKPNQYFDKEFYQAILGDDYAVFEKEIIQESESHYRVYIYEDYDHVSAKLDYYMRLP